MPEYTFGDITLNAPNRRAAVEKYNRRMSAKNAQVLADNDAVWQMGSLIPRSPAEVNDQGANRWGFEPWQLQGTEGAGGWGDEIRSAADSLYGGEDAPKKSELWGNPNALGHQEGAWIGSTGLFTQVLGSNRAGDPFEVPWNPAPGEEHPNQPGYFWKPDYSPEVVYRQGDEWRPATWAPEVKASLKESLLLMGLITEKNFEEKPKDLWDGTASDAFAKLLAAANAEGVTWQALVERTLTEEYVDQWIANQGSSRSRGGGGRGGGGGGGGGGGAISDEDLIYLAQKTAEGLLGRRLNDMELQAIIGGLRESILAGTSPTAAADAAIRREQGVETGAHSAGNIMNVITRMIRGGGADAGSGGAN